MKLRYSFIALSVLLMACQGNQDTAGDAAGKASTDAASADAVVLETDDAKTSYSMGANTADFLSQQIEKLKEYDVEIDTGLIIRGMEDVFADQAVMTPEEVEQALSDFNERVQATIADKQSKAAEESKAKGKAFLEENANKEGVKSTESGLQYKVIEEGEEGVKPTAEDTVRVHYRGTLIDGTEFDSSYKRDQPIDFGVTGVIPGWTEALQMMNKGAKWELYIPSDLAYGERDLGTIPPHSVLIFEVELLDINPEAAPEPEAETETE